jgi:HlyD family secretion protein
MVPVNDRFWPTPVIGNLPRLTGRLVSVSADAFEDERSGLHYYEAEVKIDRAVLEAAAPEVRLTPGMPAEVYVAIRERTVLAYPARQSFGLLLRRSPNLNPTQ